MQRLLVFFLAFVCATASAQVYRRVGPDGHVYFSDRPGPDAEQIQVTPNTAVRLPPAPGQGDATGQQDTVAPAYSSFSIVSPASNQGIRANNGDVTVVLKLVPDLLPGHTIMLSINGQNDEQIITGEDTAIELTNLSRGLHTIEATVLDEQDVVLIKADPVSFNVLRVAGGS
jgi:hypothetical protein